MPHAQARPLFRHALQLEAARRTAGLPHEGSTRYRTAGTGRGHRSRRAGTSADERHPAAAQRLVGQQRRGGFLRRRPDAQRHAAQPRLQPHAGRKIPVADRGERAAQEKPLAADRRSQDPQSGRPAAQTRQGRRPAEALLHERPERRCGQPRRDRRQSLLVGAFRTHVRTGARRRRTEQSAQLRLHDTARRGGPRPDGIGAVSPPSGSSTATGTTHSRWPTT